MPPTDQLEKLPDLEVMPDVGKLLEEQLEVDNYPKLKLQIAQAEAWQSRVAFRYRNEARLLAALRRQWLPAKIDRSITELDRTIQLEARTADQQGTVDILKDYAELLARRVSLGQSLLSSSKQEMKAGLNAT